MSTKNDYVEEIRSAVSKFLGTEFEVREPRPRFPPFGQSYKWFMWCPFLVDIKKMRHANSLWEDNSGNVWVESLPFGDTYDWVDYFYGEDAMTELEKMDLSNFSDEQTRKKFAERYPLANERLVNYERILQEISREYGVKLQFRYGSGGEGLVVFFANARVRVEGLAVNDRIDTIKRAIKALDAAYNRTEQYAVDRGPESPAY
jgi:hypothetical protein